MGWRAVVGVLVRVGSADEVDKKLGELGRQCMRIGA